MLDAPSPLRPDLELMQHRGLADLFDRIGLNAPPIVLPPTTAAQSFAACVEQLLLASGVDADAVRAGAPEARLRLREVMTALLDHGPAVQLLTPDGRERFWRAVGQATAPSDCALAALRLLSDAHLIANLWPPHERLVAFDQLWSRLAPLREQPVEATAGQLDELRTQLRQTVRGQLDIIGPEGGVAMAQAARLLGVSANAQGDSVRRRWRDLARDLHPALAAGDPELQAANQLRLLQLAGQRALLELAAEPA